MWDWLDPGGNPMGPGSNLPRGDAAESGAGLEPGLCFVVSSRDGSVDSTAQQLVRDDLRLLTRQVASVAIRLRKRRHPTAPPEYSDTCYEYHRARPGAQTRAHLDRDVYLCTHKHTHSRARLLLTVHGFPPAASARLPDMTSAFQIRATREVTGGGARSGPRPSLPAQPKDTGRVGRTSTRHITTPRTV